jgi:hypothetical protein
MAIELIRLKITRPGSSPLVLFGSVIVRSDGAADFFGDAAEHVRDVGGMLEQIRIDVPFGRVTVGDLDDVAKPALLIDALVTDGRRILGPLLLRPDQPPAVAGEIDAEIAARVHRVLQQFLAARAAQTAAAQTAAGKAVAA